MEPRRRQVNLARSAHGAGQLEAQRSLTQSERADEHADGHQTNPQAEATASDMKVEVAEKFTQAYGNKLAPVASASAAAAVAMSPMRTETRMRTTAATCSNLVAAITIELTRLRPAPGRAQAEGCGQCLRSWQLNFSARARAHSLDQWRARRGTDTAHANMLATLSRGHFVASAQLRHCRARSAIK